jgi:hypothetical protein
VYRQKRREEEDKEVRKETALISIAVTSIATAITMMPVDAEEPSTMPMIYDITPIMSADEAAEASAWLMEHGVNVPEDVRAECEAAGAFYNLCPELLEAVAWKESRFTPTAKNGSFVGMMQMHKGIHKDRIEQFGLNAFDTHASIWAAASLLHDLSEQYASEGEPVDVAVVIALYHGEDDAYTLSGYTKSILQVSEYLERAHGK